MAHDLCRRVLRAGTAAVLAITPLTLPLSADDAVDRNAVAAMERFLTAPTTAHQYSGSRCLEASAHGQQAWLDVQTDFTSASGLLYEVTAEGGSRLIRARVLRSLLDEERELIARGGSDGIAISIDNYRFTPERLDEEGLAIVRITPLRKERSLIVGRMFLTVDGELVRIEGRLAKNPSFWLSRVNIVRSYRRINGVLMPVALDTTAQLRLFGSSSLRMTYHYSHINERPVDGESVGC